MKDQYEIIGPNRLWEMGVEDYFLCSHSKISNNYLIKENIEADAFDMLPTNEKERKSAKSEVQKKAILELELTRTKLHAEVILDMKKEIIERENFFNITFYGTALITKREKSFMEAEKDFRNTYRDQLNAIKYDSKNRPITCTFLERNNIIRIKNNPLLMAYVLASEKMEEKEGRAIMKMISKIVPKHHYFQGNKYSVGKGLFGPN